MTLRFLRELSRGLYTFNRVQNCVTVYGSARFKENSAHYATAQRIGKLLAQHGFDVMTGGGPGIMEAANRGAKQAEKGLSIGCAIELPFGEKQNDYLDKWIKLRYFFSRKLMLTKHSIGFIAMPGGFGYTSTLFCHFVFWHVLRHVIGGKDRVLAALYRAFPSVSC